MRGRSDERALRAKASEAAQLASLFANETRILILCELLAAQEVSVGALVTAVGLSQSALSQQLGKLRAGGAVEARREGQNVYYRLSWDERALRMMALLKDLYRR
jgi:DNA-binding transcriptional ArsR family regulator